MQNSAGISREYKENFDSLKDFFTYAPGRWRDKLSALEAECKSRRQDAADELLVYHQRLGASQAVLENIDKLKQPGTIVVMTGQQPGLLTGPLYTIYKALSVVKLALKLKRELGREVVPLFWSATEDHDLEEINQAGLLSRQDELIQLNLEIAEKYHGWRVGEIPLNESREDFFAQLEQLLGENSWWEVIKDTYENSADWGEWFARQMLALFGQWGLIIVDPNLPGLRRVMAPVMRHAIEEPLLFSKLVNEQGELLAQLGYKGQVKRPAQACCFFLIENRQRQRVDFADGVYKTSRNTYSRDDLLKKLDEQPQDFSANVVLRPSCGEYLFSSLAYIGGDAEIAYFAQLKPVFEYLKIQMPIILPRYSVTLVEARIQKILSQYSIDPGQLQSQTAQQVKKVGRTYCRLANPEYWEGIKREVMTPLNHLLQEAELEKMAVPALDGGIKKIAWQLNQLEEKVIQRCQKNNELLRQRLTRANDILFPNGKLQERKLNFYYFYKKYGAEFLPALLEALPDDSNKHYFAGVTFGE